MRIGLFTDTYTPQVNGVVTVVRLMARELAAWGHEVVVFAPSYSDSDSDSDSDADADAGSDRQGTSEDGRVLRFPSWKFRFHPESRLTWPYRRAMTERLRRLDVVHSHTPFSLGLLGLWAARRYGLPHVHTYHTYFTEYLHYLPRPIRPSKRLAQRLSRAFCDRCDLVLAPSRQMKQELERYGIRTPIEAAPFGIDLEAFRGPLRRDLRRDLGVPAGARILLTAGRLGREKNFPLLLEVFALVRRELGRGPDAQEVVLVFAGDGPARAELEAQAQSLGISPHVRFPGYIERARLLDYYRQADLFVFASKTETQGIVLLEAQAAGTPVVAVGAMGVLEVVDHGRSGLLVSEDPSAFSAAVVELLRDEKRLTTMRHGALALAQERSARRSCETLIHLYRRLRSEAEKGNKKKRKS